MKNKVIAFKGSMNAEFDNNTNEVYFSEFGEYIFKLKYSEIDELKLQVDLQRKSVVDRIIDFMKKVVCRPDDKYKTI
jgi:hypothetical protein